MTNKIAALLKKKNFLGQEEICKLLLSDDIEGLKSSLTTGVIKYAFTENERRVLFNKLDASGINLSNRYLVVGSIVSQYYNLKESLEQQIAHRCYKSLLGTFGITDGLRSNIKMTHDPIIMGRAQ